MLSGNLHTANAMTMATDILRTFLSFFKRRSLALVDCFPGGFCDLILKAMAK